MPEPTTELYDIDWRETSFVGAPDNPPARIVMWKDEPTLTDEEIEEVLRETETERRAGMPTLSKRSEVEAHVGRLAKQEYPDVAARNLNAAMSKIWAERPDLREAHEGAQADRIAPAPAQVMVVKGASAFAKIDAHARESYPDLYDHSPSAARTKAREKRPDLGEAYDREFGAR